MRIAAGGFLHETNTFSPVKATLADFATPDAWPGIIRGEEIAPAVAGLNLPMAGFLAESVALGHEILPLIWASAAPSGPVTELAFEAIAAEMVNRLAAAGPVDALFLDLHGAMVTEHLQDGDGALLVRLRDALGSAIPIVAVLDFHANVTGAMVDAADLLVAYRTYPHVDMDETGRRAARLIGSVPPGLHKAFRKLPYLVPLHWQSTLAEPMAGLMRLAETLEARPGILSVSFAAGFAMADIAESGPALVVSGTDPAAVDQAAEELEQAALAAEKQFAGELLTPADAAFRAIAAPGPVILADTQDNPGAGGTADTVGILRALVEAGAENAVVAVLCDAEAAAAAHAAGIGATIRLTLGSKAGVPREPGLAGRYVVEALGDGQFTGTGPFYLGCRMQLGPMALLRINGVRVIVSSRRQQAADRAMFHHVGLDPAAAKILALKSSVHFRADFGALSERIWIVAAPGENTANPNQLTYRHLRPGVRIEPLGTAFVPPRDDHVRVG